MIIITMTIFQLISPGGSGHACSVVQSCLTLCNPMDCSPSGSSVHGILQARILEWLAIPFSKEYSWSRVQTRVSHIAGRYFTIWATREAHDRIKCCKYRFHQGLNSPLWVSDPLSSSMLLFILPSVSWFSLVFTYTMEKYWVLWSLLDSSSKSLFQSPGLSLSTHLSSFIYPSSLTSPSSWASSWVYSSLQSPTLPAPIHPFLTEQCINPSIMTVIAKFLLRYTGLNHY